MSVAEVELYTRLNLQIDRYTKLRSGRDKGNPFLLMYVSLWLRLGHLRSQWPHECLRPRNLNYLSQSKIRLHINLDCLIQTLGSKHLFGTVNIIN